MSEKKKRYKDDSRLSPYAHAALGNLVATGGMNVVPAALSQLAGESLGGGESRSTSDYIDRGARGGGALGAAIGGLAGAAGGLDNFFDISPSALEKYLLKKRSLSVPIARGVAGAATGGLVGLLGGGLSGLIGKASDKIGE